MPFVRGPKLVAFAPCFEKLHDFHVLVHIANASARLDSSHSREVALVIERNPHCPACLVYPLRTIEQQHLSHSLQHRRLPDVVPAGIKNLTSEPLISAGQHLQFSVPLVILVSLLHRT